MKKTFRDFGIDVPANATGEYRAVCPKCPPHKKKGNRKDRDLSVNVAEETWFCHRCGFKGGLGKSEINNQPKAPSNQQKRCSDAKKAFSPPSLGVLNKSAMAWLKTRGISVEAANAAGLGTARVWFPQLGRETEAVAFPFRLNGEIVAVKYRAIEEKAFLQAAGGRQDVFFNQDAIIVAADILITEGEMDALTLIECGFQNTISCPNGAPSEHTKNADKKLSFLETNAELLASAKRVFLAMDKDAPGLNFEKLIAERIGPERCFIVDYKGCEKDINEVLLTHGRQGVLDCLSSPKPYPVAGIKTFYDFADSIRDYRANKGRMNTVSTGINRLDSHFSIMPGSLNIVTGIPGHGKSELIDQMVVNTIRDAGWKWALFSPENYPPAYHFQKLAEKYANKPMFQPYSPNGAHKTWNVDPMNDAETENAIAKLSERVFLLTPDETPSTPDSVLDRIRVCVRRDKVNAFVIDPFNELEHARPSGMTETEYISAFLSRVRNFARLHNVAAFIVAHPAKMLKDKDGGYPVPTAYDVSGSANWRNKATFV